MNRWKTYLLASAGTIMVAAPAFAETAQSGSGLEEVVVTAQRRSESLSKTPAAVAVISGEALAKAQIVSEQDLQYSVPGLQVRGTLNAEQLNYTLRGQTVDAYSGTRPGVLPYVNEVQIGGAGTSSAFYDLQSVQVLKGPQGVLFGRSATGGAVLFTTQKPTNSFGGYFQGTVGDYAAGQVEGAINLPVVKDKVLLRVAGFYQRHDGYQENLFSGRDAGKTEREGFRTSLTVYASDRLQNDLVVDYLHSRGDAMGAILSGLPANAATPLSSLYAGIATPAARATGIATLQAFTGASTAAATAQYDAYFSDPKHFQGGIASYLAAQKARGPYVNDLDLSNNYQNNNIILTNATTFDLNDAAKIKNIFGYTHLDNLLISDTDATPYALAQYAPPAQLTVTRQLSDEIQLQGQALSNRLNYVAGLYFSDERVDYEGGFVNLDILFGGAFGETRYRQHNTTYATYAHGTYKLTDRISANAGVRFTSERVQNVNLQNDSSHVFCGVVGYNCDQRNTYDKVSWQVGLQDQINPDLLVYVVSRRAYKSGGFNPTQAPLVGTAAIGGTTFLAEEVTDVELGAKFQGRVANMPARANIALFHDWEVNSQRQAFVYIGVNPNGVTANVPEGSTSGVEFDGQIVPVDWLTLGASLAYLHADFSGVTEGSTAQAGCSGATVYAACYDQVPDAPKFSWTLYGDVAIPVTEDLSATLHGDVYHQTSATTSTQSSNSDGTKLPAYVVANFSAGIEDKSRGWSITANIKNAFDEVYYTGGIPLGTLEFNTLVAGDPRTYSVRARINF